MSYTSLLADFAHAVIQHDSAPMIDAIGSARASEFSAAARLSVYQDGYVERLIKATLADYPALSNYLGAAPSEALARRYVEETPSTVWDLNLYSVGFAGFLSLQGVDPAALALARLESAIAEVFWLEDSEALVPEAFALVSFDAFASLIFSLRTASALLSLSYSAEEYLCAFRDGREGALVSMEEFLCVVRHENEVQRVRLEPMEYALLSAFGRGLSVGTALEEVSLHHAPDALLTALPGYFERWIRCGVLRVVTSAAHPFYPQDVL